jgi:serine/threonine-protein kinase
VIGEGGMGRVYEARHVRLSTKRYAIKVLHHEYARQPEIVARFQREAESASGLEHPNVVGVYDVNRTNDGRPYIVQELLAGLELGRYLDDVGKLPPAPAVRIVRQVARALGAAHARGIIHRDVKPENVFLLGDLANPFVKVLDFGISKTAESGTELTKTGMVMGTPSYMAPEQARGDRVDARADVYSLGAILYRALTGQKPFESADQIATLTLVLAEEPPRPRSIEPSIPHALELVIQHAMAKEPSERLQNMAELDAALAAFDTSDSPTVISAPIPSSRTDDAQAKTVLASDAATLLGITRTASRARPALVGYTLIGVIGIYAMVVDGVLAAVRLGDPTRAPTSAEVTLALFVSGAVLAAPLILWLRWMTKSVWKSTPRAIDAATRARRALTLGAATYAIATIGIHLFELGVRQSPTGIAWPLWSLVALVLAGLIAICSWFLPKMLARRRS